MMKRTLLQTFSFGEASDAVAGLREYGKYSVRSFQDRRGSMDYLLSLRQSMRDATAASAETSKV